MSRGGYREGAGRPKGALSRATAEHSQRLSEIARCYTEDALKVLLDVAKHGRTDAARVSAANAILDRAYGKARDADAKHVSSSVPTEIRLVAGSASGPEPNSEFGLILG